MNMENNSAVVKIKGDPAYHTIQIDDTHRDELTILLLIDVWKFYVKFKTEYLNFVILKYTVANKMYHNS